MTRVRTVLHKSISRTLLAGLAVTVLQSPPYALSAERDGTVLFFSFAEVKKALSSPSPWQWSPSFS